MKYWEIFSGVKREMVEDFETLADFAERNMKAAKSQKKQAQIQKTKASLTNQQKQLSDINREGF